jgi:hypothetical protein
VDDIDKKRLESTLEGIVAIITELQNVKTDIQNIDKRLTKVEQNQAMQQKSIADTHIMANNIVNDVEDIKSDIGFVSDKIDTLDNTVRNIRVFKYFSGEV